MSKGAILLRQWRTDRKLSQAKACALFDGMHNSQLAQYERGVRRPGLEAAGLFLRVCEIPMEAWLEPVTELSEQAGATA